MSRIITFYAHEGGIGRTFALANIAVLLAKRNKRVLLIDLDLASPKLESYFQEEIAVHPGIIDLLYDLESSGDGNWRHYVQEAKLNPDNLQDNPLTFISSGVGQATYAEKVRNFPWPKFLETENMSTVLERWRDEWKKSFDFVLINSGSGITQTNGICNAVFPDFMVLVFTARKQNLARALGMIDSVQKERLNLPMARPPLTILPLLSHFDLVMEQELANQHLEHISKATEPLFADWLPIRFKPRQILELTHIPYANTFCHSKLPALTHSLTNPQLPGFYLENATRLLVSDFRDAARIIDPNASDPEDAATQVRLLIRCIPFKECELQELLTSAEKELGKSSALASLFRDVGIAFFQQHQLATAESYLSQALAIDMQYLGPQHPDVVKDRNTLIALFEASGHLPNHGSSLPTEKKPLIRNHPLEKQDARTLARKLRDNDLVLFAGAGLSHLATAKDGSERRIPLWAELIEAIAGHFEFDARDFSNNPLDLFDAIAYQHSPGELENILRRILDDKGFEFSNTHLALKKLPWRRVVTTNYDNLLNHLFEEQFPIRIEQDYDRIHDARIIQIHGCLVKPHTLSRDDYRLWKEKYPRAAANFRSLAENHTLLFVGYSLSDPHIDELLTLIRTQSQNRPKRHYGLFWHLPKSKQELLDRRDKITAISIEAEEEWENAFLQIQQEYDINDINKKA